MTEAYMRLKEEHARLSARVERLTAAFLKYLQTENECDRTSQPCQSKCGCLLEMQTYVDEQFQQETK